ncbi:endonuclease III, partial [Chlamydiia bacterium]|nr:endonuclease III [Chlamydiia bacterium]
QIMATLSVSEIESYIKTCGLYRNKAKSIVALSQTLVTSYNGKVPHDRSLLEALPGVGKKTAGVFIAQQTCGNAFPVDTHIKRCAHRWKLSKNNDPNKIEKDLQGLFPKTLWNKLHLQIILYARKYSPAKAFDPLKCEIQQFVDAQTQRKKNMSSTSLYFM